MGLVVVVVVGRVFAVFAKSIGLGPSQFTKGKVEVVLLWIFYEVADVVLVIVLVFVLLLM